MSNHPMRGLYPRPHDYSSAESQVKRSYAYGRDLEYIDTHNQAAFEVDLLLNHAQLERVRACFINQLVYQRAGTRRRCMHPEAAALSQFSKADLFSETLNGIHRVIDLGGNILDTFKNSKKIKPHHTCLIATDVRDLHRYLVNINSGLDMKNSNAKHLKAYKKALLDNEHNLTNLYTQYTQDDYFNQGSVCFGGGQRCNHKASLIIANHCLYDIEPWQIYEIMESHDASTLVSWTFYPPQLWWDSVQSVMDLKNIFDFYSFRQYEVNGTKMASMHFNDSSFAYVHKSDNWRRLFELNVIIGHRFNICVEIQDQVGLMFKQRWTRVPSYARVRCLEHYLFYDWLKGYVMVPNVYKYFDQNCIHELTHIVVPRVFYTRIYNQSLKTIELKADIIHQFSVSIGTRIDITDTVVNEAVHLDPVVLNELVYSIVFLSLYRRKLRKEVFEKCIKELSEYGPHDTSGCFHPFKVMYFHYKMYRKYRQAVNKERDDYYSDLKLDECEILEFAPLRFDTQYVMPTDPYRTRPHNVYDDDEHGDGDGKRENKSIRGESVSTHSIQLSASAPPQGDNSSMVSMQIKENIRQLINPSEQTADETCEDDDSVTGAEFGENIKLARDLNLSVVDADFVMGADDVVEQVIAYCVERPINERYVSVEDLTSENMRDDPYGVKAAENRKSQLKDNTSSPEYKSRDDVSTGDVIMNEHALRGLGIDSQPDDSSEKVIGPDYVKCVHIPTTSGKSLKLKPYRCILLPECEDNILAHMETQYQKAEKTTPSRQAGNRALMKLKEILNGVSLKNNCVWDVGCGPGNASTLLKTAKTLHGITLDVPVKEKFLDNYDTIITDDVINHQQLCNCKLKKLVYCDIGGYPIWKQTCKHVIRMAMQDHSSIIMKAFIPKDTVAEALLDFCFMNIDDLRLFRCNYSGETNGEIYICGTAKLTSKSQADYDLFQHNIMQFEARRRVAVSNYIRNLSHSQRVAKSGDQLTIFKRQLITTVEQYNQFKKAFISEVPPAAYEGVSKIANVPMVVDVQFCTGVPGCGKSRIIHQLMMTHSTKKCVIVVPYNELCKEYKKYDYPVRTFHMIFAAKKMERRILIVDEAFCFYIPYIHMLNAYLKPLAIYLFGDPMQIPASDFTKNKSFGGIDDMSDVTLSNWRSVRCPSDATNVLRNIGYPNMVTSSNTTHSIYFVNTTVDMHDELKKCYGDGPLMVFNQETSKDFNVKTIHQTQGASVPIIYFYIDERAMETTLTSSVCHVRVMLSRHSDKIVFIGQNSYMKRYLDFVGSNMQITLERYNMYLVDATITIEEQQKCAGTRPMAVPIRQQMDIVIYDQVTVEMAVEVLDKMFPQSDAFTGIAGIADTSIDHFGGGKLMVRDQLLYDKIRRMDVKGYQIVQSCYANRQFSDPITALGSLSGRYSKETKDFNTTMVRMDVHRMIGGFMKFCPVYQTNKTCIITDDVFTNSIIVNLDQKAFAWLQALRHYCTLDMYMFHMTEFLRAMDKKNMPRDMFDRIIDDHRDFWITFHPKKQVKPKVQDNPFDVRKVSQGVLAYEKHVNLLYAAYGRMLGQFLQQNVLPEVLIGQYMTDQEMTEFTRKCFEGMDQDTIKALKYLAGDFSEYDSTQGKMAFMFMSVFYVCMGMPLELVDRYRDHSENWVAKNDMMKMKGHLKFHSGTFETWLRNTMYNMANTGLMYKWVKLIIALFTGDDSGLAGHGVEFDYASDWLKKHELILKNEEPPFIEFAGKFLLPCGLIMDPVRRITKFLSKISDSIDTYNETIISLRCGLEAIPDQYALDYAAHATYEYYTYTKKLTYVPTPAEIKLLYGFLHTEAMNPRTYKDLVSVHVDILALSKKGYDVDPYGLSSI